MDIRIKLSAENAVKKGKNTTSYVVSVDITALSEKQKDFLAKKIGTSNDNAYITDNSLLDDHGNLTAESIQLAIDKMQNDVDETFELQKNMAINAIEKLRCDRTAYTPIIFFHSLCEDENLSDVQKSFKSALENEYKELQNRYKAEDQAKIDLFRINLQLLVDMYEKGGPRPEWKGHYIGPKDLLNRIIAEDKKRKNAEDQASDTRRLMQLTEVVTMFGSDLQKKKWSSGMMKRREAMDLLWKNTFTHDTPFKTSIPLYYQTKNIPVDVDDGIRITEGKIEKLTDEEFESLEHIKKSYPDFYAYTMREVAFEGGETISEYTFVRLSKKIGEYEMCADFVL